MENSIETKTALISKIDNGIIRVEIKDHAVLEASSLDENYKAYTYLSENKGAPFLILVNETATISVEGRKEYNAKNNREIRLADALVIKNPATMLLINSQVKFIKTKVPTQAFLDEKSALRWLQKFAVTEAV